jgi:hypothetical protein
VVVVLEPSLGHVDSMHRRFVLLALSAIAAIAVLILPVGCGSSTGRCSPDNCSGCCTADNACEVGNLSPACGAGGQLCSTCGPTQQCTLGFCSGSTSSGGGRGGGGGSTGGGSTGGGSTGGGAGGGTSAGFNLDISTHDTVHLDSARGFTFTAPANMVITRLRVPVEAQTTPDVQTIEVVRFLSPVPVYPSTSISHISLGRYAARPGGEAWVTVDIPVTAGSIIGVIGMRGDNASVSGSYALNNTYATSFFGISTTLYRLGTLGSMVDAGVTDLFTESTNPFGRVELTYRAP